MCFWVLKGETWAEGLYFKVIGLGEIDLCFLGTFVIVCLPR